MAFKRRPEPTTIDEERAALQAQYGALEDLKRELAERVGAVRERELELHHALAEASSGQPTSRRKPAPLPAAPVIAVAEADTGDGALRVDARQQALLERERAVTEREGAVEARNRELDARERELAGRLQQEGELAAAPDAVRLEQIETRLAELREAEKLFLRTRDELAARSEAVSARERLVAQKERELDDREDRKDPWAGPGLSEMEARLRRLEQQQPGEQTLGFSGGLKKLQQGTKRPQ